MLENNQQSEETSFKTQKDTKDKYVFYVPETSFRDKLVRIGAMMGMSETARYQRDVWQQVESALHMGMIVGLESENKDLIASVDSVSKIYYGEKYTKDWQFVDAPSHRQSPAELPFVDYKAIQYPPLYWLFTTSEETYADQDFITIRGYSSNKDGDNAIIEKLRYAIWSMMVQRSYRALLPNLEKIIVFCSEYLNVRKEVEQLRDEIRVSVDRLMNALETEHDRAIAKGKEMFNGEKNIDEWGDDISYFATVNVIKRNLPKKMHVDIQRWSYDPDKVNKSNDFGSFSAFGGIKADVQQKDEHLFAKLTHDRMYNLQIMASIAHNSALDNESATTTYRKFGEIVQYIAQGIEQIHKSNSEKSEGGAKYERYQWWTPEFAMYYNEVITYYINIKYAMENNFLTSATQDEMNIFLNMNFMIEQCFLLVNRWVRRGVEFILQRKAVDKTGGDGGLGGGSDWSE